MYNGRERKSIRLKNYDYSLSGIYFVTICTKNREEFFGKIVKGNIILNEYGKVVEEKIIETERIRKEIKIDEFIVMPNHVHLLIIIENDRQSGTMQSFPTIERDNIIGLKGNNLSSIIRGLKGTITKQINDIQNNFIFGWQKSFFDVVIRNEEQLEKTRQYIVDNPLKWELDKNNPVNIKNVGNDCIVPKNNEKRK